MTMIEQQQRADDDATYIYKIEWPKEERIREKKMYGITSHADPYLCLHYTTHHSFVDLG